jgi:UDP-glucose 4-epimerase
MNTIVTGGAGFIGSHLVERLIYDNHSVTVLDNFSTGRYENLEHLKNKIKIIECDLNDENNIHDIIKGADWVFHLAALADIVPSIQNPKKYFDANVNATLRLLQACKDTKISKFVYAASSSCYGIPDIYPTPENALINPQYPYALTKRMGEELVIHWAEVYNIPSISLRFFNVYGPRSRTSGTYGAVFGVFLAQKLAKKPLTIVGDGTQTRDFTFVTDVVEAIYISAQSKVKNKIYNVGSGKTISINFIAKLLNGETVNIPKRPAEPDITFADISKIKSELNWLPKVSIEEGIAELLKNIEYWENAPVWTPETIEEATRDWFHYLSKK